MNFETKSNPEHPYSTPAEPGDQTPPGQNLSADLAAAPPAHRPRGMWRLDPNSAQVLLRAPGDGSLQCPVVGWTDEFSTHHRVGLYDNATLAAAYGDEGTCRVAVERYLDAQGIAFELTDVDAEELVEVEVQFVAGKARVMCLLVIGFELARFAEFNGFVLLTLATDDGVDLLVSRDQREAPEMIRWLRAASPEDGIAAFRGPLSLATAICLRTVLKLLQAGK